MTFFTSSYSVGQGNCVAVDFENVSPNVVVRHSQYPRHVLEFTPAEWDAFVRGVKAGEFDRPGAYESDAELAARQEVLW